MVISGVLVLGMVVMVGAFVSRRRGSQPPVHHAADEPMVKQAIPGAKRAVRLDLHVLPSSPDEPESPFGAGPGQADASSLLTELLKAIQDNAYDDFVAKGSARFKAAVQPSGLRGLSTNLGARLASGFRPTLLGSLRKPKGTLWLFRLEFADGGDDALVSMTMDGWQVAGFFIEDPQTSEKEK
jgi:hypothetical protein